MTEHITQAPLSELHTFKNHPFRVSENDELRELARSIGENGVLSPALVRSRRGGGYELISGHRRKAACELAGVKTMPVIVRELDDIEAVIVMVDSNKQREHLLPSEKAFAYKMRLEAMKKQGKRNDLSLVQVAPKLTVEIIGEENNESKDRVKRYIRLTSLIPELLQMVDDKCIAFSPAVELSYLSKPEQEMAYEFMRIYRCTPSLSQAVRLKNLHKTGMLDNKAILDILSEKKANQKEKITLPMSEIRDFFPQRFPADKMRSYILELLRQHPLHTGRDS